MGSPKFNNDGCYMTPYSAPSFKDPGFFSITIYDADGWMYSEDGILNEYNMSLNEDGSFDARFGDSGTSKTISRPLRAGTSFSASTSRNWKSYKTSGFPR